MNLRRLAALLALTSLCALAQDRKIYVNLETLFDNDHKTVSANLAFENRKQEVEDQLSLIRKEIESLNTDARKLDGEMRNELLAREAREAASRKLQACIERLRTKNREYEATRRDNYQQLQKIRLEREDELVKEIVKVIDAVADEQKATEVIEVSGKTLNRVVVYLRYPKEKEITAEVLRRLNAGHEEELKTAKQELERRRAAAEKASDTPALPEKQ